MRVLAGLVLFLGLCMPATAGQVSPTEYQYWTDRYKGSATQHEWDVDICYGSDLFDQELCIGGYAEYSRDEFQRLFDAVCCNRDRNNFVSNAEVTVVTEYIVDENPRKFFDIECEDGWSFIAYWQKNKFKETETWRKGYLVIYIEPSLPRSTESNPRNGIMTDEQIEQLLDEIYGDVGVEPTPTPTPTPIDENYLMDELDSLLEDMDRDAPTPTPTDDNSKRRSH